jgi:outer membrane receptor protein involved in Fe transport
VVAHTFEIGVRGGRADRRLDWSADLFRTVNHDDIQFIATTTNSGYFDNVGNTRRQGLDLALGGRAGALTWKLIYSFVDATYQSAFEVSAESNSTADANGNIQVHPGDRLPLVPRHTGRLVLDYALSSRLQLGANLVLASGSFLHGNENNANQAGGTNGAGEYIEGSGQIPGYLLVNLQAAYRVGPALEAFVRVVNLLDRQYATAGFLTSNTFTPSGVFRSDPADWTHENAVSPGAPRGVWGGVRLRFD